MSECESDDQQGGADARRCARHQATIEMLDQLVQIKEARINELEQQPACVRQVVERFATRGAQ